MKIEELMADPVGAIDAIVTKLSAHAMLSFADAEITPEELAAVAEMNAAVAVDAREEIRLLMIRVLRQHGAYVPNDFGAAPVKDSWADLKPLGVA